MGSLFLLIGAIALATPRQTQGQRDEPVGPTKPVKVVNTSAEPVPVTGNITGSVNIANSPNVNVVNTPTVHAQQSGAWDVGITGTPTVRIDPTGNGVTVAPRQTTLVLSTGIYDPSVGGYPALGPLAISPYSKIRIFAENFSDSGGDIIIGPRVTLPGGGSLFLEEAAFIRLEPGERFSRVYEVPGGTLVIDLGGNGSPRKAAVAVFGN